MEVLPQPRGLRSGSLPTAHMADACRQARLAFAVARSPRKISSTNGIVTTMDKRDPTIIYPLYFAVTSYSASRSSVLKDDAPGGLVRETTLQMSITGADMPGGPPATEAWITFTDQTGDRLEPGVLIGTINDTGDGSAQIWAALPSAEFDIYWKMLRHGQPVTFFCLIQNDQVGELDLQCGTGITRTVREGRPPRPRRPALPRPTVPV